MTPGNLDIRLPIGLLFAVLGGLLVVYGLATRPELYDRSLDINVNLWWGLAMLVFGALMIGFGRRSGLGKPQDQGQGQDPEYA